MQSEIKKLNLITISLVLLAISLGYWQDWLSLFQLWNDSYDYTHGFLVFFVTIWLLYTKREEILKLQPDRWWIFLPALIVTASAHLLAKAADVKTVATLSLPCFLIFSGLLLYGKQFFIKVVPTLALLYFALPVWDDIAPLLQRITVFTNQFLLGIFDIPAVIRDLYITIPQGTFFVAGGCSGSRYLLVAMFIANVYGILYLQDIRRSLMLFFISIFFSMLANWVRVFGIIYAGYQTDMKSSLVNDHEVYGWVIFALVCLLPLFISAHFIEKKAANGNPEEKEAASTDHPAYSPSFHRSAVLVSITLFTLLFSPTWLFTLSLTTESESANTAHFQALPVGDQNWKGPLIKDMDWKPSFHNTDLSTNGVYINETGETLQLSINWYFEQHQGKELIYFNNLLFDEKQWSLIRSSSIRLSTASELKVAETLLKKKNTESYVLIRHWYQVGGFIAETNIEAKVLGAFSKLAGDESGGLIAIAKYCDSAQECNADNVALDSLSQFVAKHFISKI
ncbi:exosortase A [Hahella sp. KA22]|uniref:exosortase A n=1 Tax=Hahella sp. KA22 TaxID=1628392 RepID=UPI000FDF583C|nr:exosortase A [Hahella sp. KA22]AZZ92982.1 exosortase A [Hahella sp. KA22]QAY56356.1 exosortase A [Hahella sp. KA22]